MGISNGFPSCHHPGTILGGRLDGGERSVLVFGEEALDYVADVALSFTAADLLENLAFCCAVFVGKIFLFEEKLFAEFGSITLNVSVGSDGLLEFLVGVFFGHWRWERRRLRLKEPGDCSAACLRHVMLGVKFDPPCLPVINQSFGSAELRRPGGGPVGAYLSFGIQHALRQDCIGIAEVAKDGVIGHGFIVILTHEGVVFVENVVVVEVVVQELFVPASVAFLRAVKTTVGV